MRWYEQAVLDPAWPRRPEIVRPSEGGANRKLFWIPANLLAFLMLLLALWAAWPRSDARAAVLGALVLNVVVNAWTAVYFGPAVLRVEKAPPPPDDPSSLAWVRRSRWRTFLARDGRRACLGADDSRRRDLTDVCDPGLAGAPATWPAEPR